MSKLTLDAAARHQRACELLALGRKLTFDERLYVLTHYQESATTVNATIGAYFTPMGLAREVAWHVSGSRVIDLGAGIGRLGWAWLALCASPSRPDDRKLVCVERNREYYEVGKRVLPQAEWICGDVLKYHDLGLETYDTAIANPPYGRTRLAGRGPRYKQANGEYCFIDVASELADHGVFIIPQESAPRRYSGHQLPDDDPPTKPHALEQATGIVLEPSVGVDTTEFRDEWRDVAPTVEIVTADFDEARERRQAALW